MEVQSVRNFTRQQVDELVAKSKEQNKRTREIIEENARRRAERMARDEPMVIRQSTKIPASHRYRALQVHEPSMIPTSHCYGRIDSNDDIRKP